MPDQHSVSSFLLVLFGISSCLCDCGLKLRRVPRRSSRVFRKTRKNFFGKVFEEETHRSTDVPHDGPVLGYACLHGSHARPRDLLISRVQGVINHLGSLACTWHIQVSSGSAGPQANASRRHQHPQHFLLPTWETNDQRQGSSFLKSVWCCQDPRISSLQP